MIGPVSDVVLAELSAFVRQHALVLWLDPTGQYADLARALDAAGAPFPVVCYEGSWISLMFKLDPFTRGADPLPLVVYLPNHTPETIRATPALEVYEAGRNFRPGKLRDYVEKAGAGRVPAEALAALMADPELTLSRADGWLGVLLAEQHGGREAWLQSLPLGALLDELLAPGGATRLVGGAPERAALHRALELRLGLSARWRQPEATRGEEMAFLVAAYALCVEYVHDLRRAPESERLEGLSDLPAALVEASREICAHLRDRHPAFYRRAADEVQGWLPEELARATADDLGVIDTFRFEEERLFDGALADLDANTPTGARWGQALAWARPRAEGASFWTRNAPERQAAWALLREAAALGLALERARGAHRRWQRPEDAVDTYVSTGAAVDRAHRELEQRWTLVWPAPLPGREALRARVEALRQDHWYWANQLAREFAALQHTTPLPDSAGQQRAIFETVLRPMLAESGCTALFFLDAFRYELATALVEALEPERGGATLTLQARLAELPTRTAVGMNALVPIAEEGQLRPVIRDGDILGFQAREFQVVTPDHRRRVLGARVGGPSLPWYDLEQLGRLDVAALRATVKQSRMLVVMGDDVDAAGEAGIGLDVFERALVRVRGAWRLLREAGVRRFVFTADHGFLLLDAHTASQQPRGVGNSPRHLLTTSEADGLDELRIPLTALGYVGSPLQLVMPAGVAVFKGRPTPQFVHGGASLQERVIPVLTVVHRAAPGSDSRRYLLRAELPPADAPRFVGAHAVLVRLTVADQAGLRFGGERPIEVGIRAIDAPGVQGEIVAASPGTALHGGSLAVGLDAPVIVYFRLLGAEETTVAVELLHPTGTAAVEPATAPGFYAVVERDPRPKEKGTAPPPVTPAPAPQAETWLERVPEAFRPVFRHLATHGHCSEAEVISLLGGPRAARRFALELDALTQLAPFGVSVDTSGGQKHYNREGSGR